MEQFIFVSFDITSHAAEPYHTQVERIANLNDLVGAAIGGSEGNTALWASGGDGGHIAYRPANAVLGVPNVIRTLKDWSTESATTLRIVAHAGISSTVRGADGRMQLVGDGINLCGSLLEVASDDAIIVTAPFAEFFNTVAGSGLRFHDPRYVYLKTFRMTEIRLCSIEGKPASFWMPLHGSDRTMLKKAMKDRAPWDVIYYARRIIQANSDDSEAKAAITAAKLGSYGDLTPNRNQTPDEEEPSGPQLSLVALLGLPPFLSFVETAELVERRDGEVLCNQDDPGDTMFIVLRGQLALVTPATSTGDKSVTAVKYQTKRTFGPGDVVGELAVALRTKRTATLQAIGATALLSFSHQSLRQFLNKHKKNRRYTESLNIFIDQRILDYMCNRADYLVGWDHSRRGPLSAMPQPWEFLYEYTKRLDFSAGEQFDASDERFAGSGLYILASGTLGKHIFGMPVAEPVEGSKLPLIFLDFPNRLVNRFGSYRVRTPSATLVHIEDAAFSQWGPEMLDHIISHFSRALARTFVYDAFISFAIEDHKLALEIKSVLETKGITVFLDAPTPGKSFSQYLAGAIASSLLFIVLNTHLLERKQQMREETWVEREVAFRKAAFSGHYSLLPLRIGGSRIADVLAGVTYIDIAPTFAPSFASEISSIIDELKEGRAIVPSARVPFVMQSLSG